MPAYFNRVYLNSVGSFLPGPAINNEEMDAYVGSVNKQFYNQFKDRITHIAVEGSLIKTSSPQCIKCVETYKRLVPINDFKNVIIPLAEDYGLIEGTTIENVFTNKLHWGCRHIFVGVIK